MQVTVFIEDDVLKTRNYKPNWPIEQLREVYTSRYLRKWEIEDFVSLSDDEVLEMDSWNREITEKIDCCSGKDVKMIKLTKREFPSADYEKMASMRSMPCEEQLAYSEDFIDVLKEKINDLEGNYLVISRRDLRNVFPGHCFVFKERNSLHELKALLARLKNADGDMLFSWHLHGFVDDNQPDYYHKVFFLDIDGVLNDEGEAYSKGVIIDKERVRLLKEIVDRTDASIIMSSSWKWGYNRFVKEGKGDEHIHMLQEALDENGLTISGITPISDESGPEARPFEIRGWLAQFKDVFSYVILDDDTFWTWGWLQRNVVTTVTAKTDKDGWKRLIGGLTRVHVEKAVRILNDVGAYQSNYDML